jgi:uncharacterized protein with HEPN domain
MDQEEEPHNTINLNQALETLTTMFQNIEKETMLTFLKENNGQLEATIEQLLIINETTVNNNNKHIQNNNNVNLEEDLLTLNDENKNQLNENNDLNNLNN